MSKSVTVTTGSSLHLFTLLFVALKLTGHISWSWLWVLAPSWAPLVIVFSILIFALVRAFVTKPARPRR